MIILEIENFFKNKNFEAQRFDKNFSKICFKKLKNEKKFGSIIREIRIQKGFGQRELASKIGVSASYLNDIEKEKRSAPKQIVIKKISKLLKINIDTLNDLAGISKKMLLQIL